MLYTKKIIIGAILFVIAFLTLVCTPVHAQDMNDNGTVPGRLYWSIGASSYGQNSVSMWGNIQTRYHIEYASSSFYTDYSDPSEWTFSASARIDLLSTAPNAPWSLESNINTFDLHINKYISLSHFDNNGVNNNAMSMGMTIRPSVFSWGAFNYNEWYDSQTGAPYGYASFQLHGSFGPGAVGDALGEQFVPEPASLSAMGLVATVGLIRRRRS